MFCIGLTMKPGLRLCEKYGKILVMGIAICCLVITVYISSLMPSIILFMFFHSAIYGLFAGLLFLTPMK